MGTASVTGLYIYPVKSCRGISLTELSLTETGPLYDRKWMIVDENNHFMTLRNFSQLAEIKTALKGPFLHLYAGENKILINLNEDCEKVETVTVWKDSFKAGIENKSVNEALSDFLNKSVKLVRYQNESFRDLKTAATDYVKQTMFADSRPILLTNQSSLDDLNLKLKSLGHPETMMLRFRPNIVIEGLSAFSEEEFRDFYIGNSLDKIKLTNSFPCGRCPVITQDIETGQAVAKEVLKTLSEYRKDPKTNRVPFGVNLTPANGGVVRVGDSITLS